MPNIANYYDSSRISKKENERTLVTLMTMINHILKSSKTSFVIVPKLSMMTQTMVMMMVYQVRLPWQMGIFSPRLSKRAAPKTEDDQKADLSEKSSPLEYLEAEEGLGLGRDSSKILDLHNQKARV